MRPTLKFSLLLLCLLAFYPLVPLHAQFDTGALVGTVRDNSGAVIPGADITITNAQTGNVTTKVSGDSGEWEAQGLRTGTYRIQAAKSGFAPAVANDFSLSVGTRQRIDLALSVGTAQVSVEVNGVALALETESSQRGQIVTHAQTEALPLVARNYSSLVLLTTGTRQSAVGTGSSSLVREGSFNVEGQRSTFNNYLLDGLDNNAYGTSNQGFSNQVIQPSPDSITQFQVVTNNESAEYGRSTGATVNVAFASGTNKLHFEAFEFLRNTAGNAIGYFALHDPITGNIVKPVLHRNQFGGNVGGPILHDRLFFFADYEGFRQTRNLLSVSTVPTLAMDQGIFPTSPTNPACEVIKDPYTGACVPAGTSVFADPNFSPAARNIAGLLAKLAPPNVPQAAGTAPSNNYETLEPFSDKLDKYDARFDYQVSSKTSTFLRVSQLKENAFDYPSLPLPLDGGSNGKQRILDQQVAIGYTRQIGANQLLDLRLGSSFTKGGKYTFSLGTADAASYGIPGLPEDNSRVAGGLPTFAFTGLSSLGRQATNPQWQYPFIFNPKVNYSRVRGHHSFKFGYEYQRLQVVDQDVNPLYGRFTYQGNFTGGGNPYGYFGDFLYGASSKYELSNFLVAHFRQVNHFGYVQDDWKVSHNLTLNIGLRYEYGSPYWDKDGNLTNFDPSTSPTTLQMIKARKSGSIAQRSLVNPDRNDFAPRFGFAFAPGEKDAIRGGFGISFIHFNRAGSGNELAINAPQVLFVVVPQAGGSNGPLPTSPDFRRLDQGFDPNLTAPSSFNPITDNITYIPKNYRDSYVESYFLSWQHELAKNVILDLAYVGNHGVKLLEFANANQKNPALNFARPYPTFGDITAALNSSYSNYNSLQFRYEQRMVRDLTLLNSFTWSRAFDNAAGSLENTNGNYPSPQDINNLSADYGPSNYDQPLTNITSIVYNLPVGRGRTFAAKAPFLLNEIIGGWQFSGINTFSSGQPLTVMYSPAAANQVSGITADFRGANNYRPNRLSGVSLYNHGAVPNTSSYVQYLNNATSTLPGVCGGSVSVQGAFAQPQTSCVSGTATTPLSPFGNASRDLAYSNVYNNIDIAMNKDFAVTERAKVQFRAEAYNLLNHTNFGVPSTTIGGSFGRITSTQPARILQLALKVSY
jgi:hypothetical protein